MKTKIDWVPIEKACVSGMSYAEAERTFGVRANTIVVRAIRDKWATPQAVANRARELDREHRKGDKTLDLLAQNWLERGETHREMAFELAHESLKKMKARKPRDWREAEIADKMARRSAGLENVEVVQNTLVQVNERINSPDELPIEATVI